MTRHLMSLGLCLAGLAGLACASGGAASRPAADGSVHSATRSDPNVLTSADLADSTLGDIDALSAIRRLRPAFLTTRGTSSMSNASGGTVHVAVDNGPLRDVDVLAGFKVREIAEIRYLGAAAAAQRYGTLAGAGPVIVVRRK